MVRPVIRRTNPPSEESPTVLKAIFPALTALALVAGLASPRPRPTARSTTIKKRGQLVCGVNTGNPGFAQPDSARASIPASRVDQCRAVAAAITGKADNVKYVPLTSQNRFTALQSGEVDMLARSATWSLTRETTLNLAFPVVTFYDGQAFMVAKKSGVKSAKSLKGATVCALTGSTSELNLADFSRANKLDIKPVSYDSLDGARDAFLGGRCDALHDRHVGPGRDPRRDRQPGRLRHPAGSDLQGADQASPSARTIAAFLHAVRWTMYAMIEAEELGITVRQRRRPHEGRQSGDQAPARRATPGLGTSMGLTDTWAARRDQTGWQLWRKLRTQRRHRRPRSSSSAASTTYGPRAA